MPDVVMDVSATSAESEAQGEQESQEEGSEESFIEEIMDLEKETSLPKRPRTGKENQKATVESRET
jgi:hypothetical protein